MNLLLVGGGGHSSVVAETALAMNKYNLISYIDDNHNAELFGEKPLGPIKFFEKKNIINSYQDIFVAIGESKIRMELIDRIKQYDYNLKTLIHPKAIISNSSSIGFGVAIFAGSVIQANVVIQDGVIINTSSSIDHDSKICSGSHICPGVHLGGNVSIGQNSWIGIGSVIKQNIRIGSNVVIGAGSVVINDVEDNKIVYGVPAKPKN